MGKAKHTKFPDNILQNDRLPHPQVEQVGLVLDKDEELLLTSSGSKQQFLQYEASGTLRRYQEDYLGSETLEKYFLFYRPAAHIPSSLTTELNPEQSELGQLLQ